MRPDDIQSILEDIRMDGYYSDAALAATAATGILFADTVAGKHQIGSWDDFPDMAAEFATRMVDQYLKTEVPEARWAGLLKHAEFVAREYAAALAERGNMPQRDSSEH